jgi:ATP-dependent Clp protease adaptor protein ClpS
MACRARATVGTDRRSSDQLYGRAVGIILVPMSETVEVPRIGGPGSGLGGAWKVIVRNDNHNTFDHVARTLARFIPGVTLDRGHEIANVIHTAGQAVVFCGHQEAAEHYWEQLKGAGLTMAPLEQG